jgi:putative transposase
MREAMQLVLQALIELEATEIVGAGRYERAETRTTHRNGSRSRLLSTKAGDVELQIPKLRHGSFFPAPHTTLVIAPVAGTGAFALVWLIVAHWTR